MKVELSVTLQARNKKGERIAWAKGVHNMDSLPPELQKELDEKTGLVRIISDSLPSEPKGIGSEAPDKPCENCERLETDIEGVRSAADQVVKELEEEGERLKEKGDTLIREHREQHESLQAELKRVQSVSGGVIWDESSLRKMKKSELSLLLRAGIKAGVFNLSAEAATKMGKEELREKVIERLCH